SGYARIELAVATTLPSAQAARVFLWLATYPWHAVTWFGPGHSVRWYHEPSTFPLGGGAGAEAGLVVGSPRLPERTGTHGLAGIPCGGCGSSRSPNGTGSWPKSAAHPPWSLASLASIGAGSSGRRAGYGPTKLQCTWRLTPSRTSHHRKMASRMLAVVFSQAR